MYPATNYGCLGLATRKEYLQLLDRVLNNLPERAVTTTRFSLPPLQMFRQGRRTIVMNFKQVLEVLRREKSFVLTYMARELAAPVVYNEPRLIIQGIKDEFAIRSVLERFIKVYVTCPACGSPDTIIVRRDRTYILRCEACGSEVGVPPVRR
ncbi:TPA: translation initiation factor IF-2 subunit beta [Candidatus Micrarchaeota archaeon]|nr:translation initiation factor IF-2 subunit beta [Candidatus Micrarchaeota archaeon]